MFLPHIWQIHIEKKKMFPESDKFTIKIFTFQDQRIYALKQLQLVSPFQSIYFKHTFP